MIKKTINNITSFLIIFSFLVLQPASAATGISSEQRTIELQNDMLQSGVPSDLPIAGYSDFFDKETVSLIKNFDISEYNNMKIMVGYGLPDKSSNNCKMVEKPGVTKTDFDNDFIKFITFNDHSYGVAKTTMSYNTCLSKANALGGYPVVIDSAGENNSIKHNFLDSGSNETLWIGMSFSDYSHPTYYNAYGNKQNFFNWEQGQEFGFDINKKNVSMNSRGKWTKENGGVFKKCIIEIESPIYYRPIRTCVPWWKIIREFPNNREALYNRKDFNKLLNADIPEKLTICTKYDEDATATATNSPTRDITCTSYQSLTAKPECQLNIELPQCYVDECSGYIKNACRHKSEKIVGKGYVKGEVIDKDTGTKKEVKIKDHVTTHTFQCPPSSISMKHCLEKSKVIIFPKECTMYGSNCFALKECVQAARTNEDIDKCYDVNNGGYYCDKIYAQRDIPPKLNPDGTLDKLYGICRNPNNPNDTTQVEFTPNILDKESKHCVEWEILEIEEQITQKCESERTYTEHTVDTSITATDIYEDNPDCVRIDKVKDSETETTVNMTVDLYNFSKTKITQTFIDNHEETIGTILGDDTYYTSLLSPINDITGGESNVVPEPTTCDLSDIEGKCSIYDNDWNLRNAKLFLDNENTDTPTRDNLVSIYKSSENKLYIKGNTTNLTSNLCSSYASDHGFSSYVSGTPTYSKNDLAESAECIYTINTMDGDAGLSEILPLTVDSTKYKFQNDMKKSDCLEKAYCLNGIYDESNFAGGWNAIGKCVVSVDGSGSPTSYSEKIREDAGCVNPNDTSVEQYNDSTCKPTEDMTATTQTAVIDGLQSILFFEGFVDAGWGYYQNTNSYSYKSNVIKINTEDITDLNVFPLLPVSTINDGLTYKGHIIHVGWRKKEPNVGMAVVGGAGAGILAYSPLLALGGPAAWVIGIIVFVVILLLSRSKKMDEQGQSWMIYKNINNAKYRRGPYESRTPIGTTSYSQRTTNETASVYAPQPANTQNYLYMTLQTHTGINYPSDYLKTLEGYTTAKKNLMICSGIPSSEVAKTISSLETGIRTGYPKCKWYKPWCEKHETKANVPTTLTIYKPTTTVYIGATNTLTILVPYKGDYLLKAYNKYDEVIAEAEIKEDSFSNYYDPNSVPYGKVQFGNGMRTSVNLNGKACVDDLMVEWGGGVSGIYFENSQTGINTDCAKSDDIYVAEQSMTKIEVIPKNLDAGFVHELEKPMPYPNRVFIASLEKLAKRKYRCYDPFKNCDDSDYVEEEGE